MNPKDICGQAKPNLSRLPLAPIIETVAALEEGRRKYGPFNWRHQKVDEVVYADAAIRHLMQFISGEDEDGDSGLSHITKAIAGLIILRDAQIHNCSIDTREVSQDLGLDRGAELIRGVVERYPDPVSAPDPAAERLVEINDASHIDATDVGRRVLLRDGRQSVIDSFADEICPVYYDHEPGDPVSCRTNGIGSLSGDTTTEYDIVGVYRPVGCAKKLVCGCDSDCQGPYDGLNITESDVGRVVKLYGGHVGRISSVSDYRDTPLPVLYDVYRGKLTYTATCDTRGRGEPVGTAKCSDDIVGFVTDPPTISKEDVGRRVLLRDGFITKIHHVDDVELTSWPVEYMSRSCVFVTCTLNGWNNAELGRPEERGNDIVWVFR